MTQGEHIRAIIPATDWELLEPFLNEEANRDKGRWSASSIFLGIYSWNKMSRADDAYKRGCRLYNMLACAEEDREQQATPLT